MADSYRKSAMLLKSSTTKPATDTNEAVAARRERLTKAHDLYDYVVDFYREHPPTNDVEKLYARLAFFYRADCLYDLGRYDEAIRAYDTAAFKHQDDPSALAAYVQIVNSYCALGKYEDARAANERARWMLKRMPPDAFASVSFILPRDYWEQWMKWSNESGLWKQENKQ
jgi:tetratricopeptide (TPR) repeat protein